MDKVIIKTGTHCKKDDYISIDIDRIASFIQKNKNSLEVYSNDRPVKLFVDIDGEFDMDVIGITHRTNIVKMSTKNWYILDGSRQTENKWKLSMHLIHKRMGFSCIKDLKYYIEEYGSKESNVIKYLKEKGLIDDSLYKRGEGSLRCIGCTMPKRGKNVPLVPLCDSDVNVLNYMITTKAKEIVRFRERIEYRDSPITKRESNIVNKEEILEMCDIIDPKYLSKGERGDWIAIGWSMRYISDVITNDSNKRDSDIFNKWINLSSKGGAIFDYNESRKVFDEARGVNGKSKGDGTIYEYAKKSNKEKFIEIKKKYSSNHDEEESKRMFLNMKHKFYYDDLIDKWKGVECNDLDPFVEDLKKVCGTYSQGSTKYVMKNDGTYDVYNSRDNDLRRESFLRMNIGGKLKDVSFYDAYRMYSPNALKYKKMDVIPNYKGTDVLNMWTGFKANEVQNINTDGIDIILKHAKEILANNNSDCYEFILDYYAWLVQKPENKTGVCLTLIGDHGVGKNIFVTEIGRYILGDGIYTEINKLEDITGNFNPMIESKLLIALCEASNASNKEFHKTFDLMKSYITDGSTGRIINKKNKPIYRATDISNFIVLSNNLFSVRIEKGDRRYCVFRCSSKRKGDRQYFHRLARSIKEYADDFYTFLKRRDLSKYTYNLQGGIPDTEIKREIKMKSITHDIGFIKYLSIKFKHYNYMTRGDIYDLYTYNYNSELKDKYDRTMTRQKLYGLVGKYYKKEDTKKDRYLRNKKDRYFSVESHDKVIESIQNEYGSEIWDMCSVSERTNGETFDLDDIKSFEKKRS